MKFLKTGIIYKVWFITNIKHTITIENRHPVEAEGPIFRRVTYVTFFVTYVTPLFAKS